MLQCAAANLDGTPPRRTRASQERRQACAPIDALRCSIRARLTAADGLRLAFRLRLRCIAVGNSCDAESRSFARLIVGQAITVG